MNSTPVSDLENTRIFQLGNLGFVVFAFSHVKLGEYAIGLIFLPH